MLRTWLDHPLFAHPQLLWGLALLPLLGLLWLWSQQRRWQALAKLGLGRNLEATLARGRPWRRLARLAQLAGLTFLVLGMAGPQWGRDWTRSTAPGRDLVVLLDCSRSMLA